jgi:hypothetical protein
MVFPPSFMHRPPPKHNRNGEVVMSSNVRELFTFDNFKKFERSWEDKVRTD